MKGKTNLQRVLTERKMRHVKLAKLSGISAGVVDKQAITGVKTLRVARRYAAVLGCDPLELLG